MSVEDVFSIKGRGTVVTGRVDRGTMLPNKEVEIVGLRDDIRKVVVTSMEMFHKILDKVEAGDNAGLLLRGVGREEIERGQVLAKPGSITPHRKFMSEVYVLRKDEGGTAQGVLQRLPAAVLHPHDGCDGRDQAAGRCRDGHAWRYSELAGGVDYTGGPGRGQPFRYSRGWPDRWRWCHHRYPGLSK